MHPHLELTLLQERVAEMARFAEGKREVREAVESRPGWLDRRRERKREKQLRTGDSPEKIAERGKRHERTPGENADRAGWAGFLGGAG